LERCDNPDDWLRREIECALDEKRNIVPLMFEDFDYGNPSIQKRLTGKLALLPQYQALPIPKSLRYFSRAMDDLRNDFLSIPLDTVLHPTPLADKQGVTERRAEVAALPQVTEEQRTAEEFFERAYQHVEAKRYEQGIADYTEAIRLKPDYAAAYNNRGYARDDLGDYAGAIADYTKSIELKNPELHLPYNNRGLARRNQGDFDGAIADYTEAIRLKPDYAYAYNNRGNALRHQDNFDGAIADYNEAIRLKPDYANAYYNRGNTRRDQGDNDGAIADWTTAIRLEPDYTNAYYNRGVAYKEQANYRAAIADYQQYLDLGGGQRDGDQEQVEEIIADLQQRLSNIP